MVEMLETMRRQTMIRIDLRKAKTMNNKGKYSPKVGKVIALEEKHKQWCKVIPGPTGLFEVLEKGTSYKVSMVMKCCSCRMWELIGIPCRHALRVIQAKKYNVDAYVSRCYLTNIWQSQYKTSIKPLNGLKFWRKSGETTLQPPQRQVTKGRKRNAEKRKKGINESPSKGKKLTKHATIIHCSRCGLSGHNSKKCSNGGVPIKPRQSKKTKTSHGVAESISLDFGESSSQPTQTSIARA